jgi:hypothetical protein
MNEPKNEKIEDIDTQLDQVLNHYSSPLKTKGEVVCSPKSAMSINITKN